MKIELTQASINVLYTRGIINRATWESALRSFRGDPGPAGPQAIRACEVAIEALVERAIDAACAVIQKRLGVKTGDLAAATLSDGTIECELTRYVHAELAMAGSDGDPVQLDAEAASLVACGHSYDDRSRCQKPARHVGDHSMETDTMVLRWDDFGRPTGGGAKGRVVVVTKDTSDKGTV